LAGLVLMRDAMHRKNILRLAPLSLVLLLAGCASADDGTASDPDAITPQELAAGQASSPSDDTDGDPSADTPEVPLTIATPPEDSASFLDPDDALFGAEAPTPPGEIDLDNLEQTKTCHRATGYRSGKAFTICLTTIDGKYVEVNTARAYLRMRKAARKSGVGIRIVSGFRSMAQQRYLYHCYKTRSCNGGNLAAPPGYSNHQSGHALDLNTSAGGVYSWLANHGRTYGFRRTVPSEKWHWEH
jgi:D-alanyl-D-alanine carboxypeptidase